MDVTIVRHTAVDVPPGLCYGQTDVPLRDSFPIEAMRIRDGLADLVFDGIFTSPLSRCTRLAGFCGAQDAERDDRLKELHFGKWENQYLYTLSDDPAVQKWFNNMVDCRTPGGESFLDVSERLRDFLEEKVEMGYDQILIFAHGGIIIASQIIQGRKFSGDVFHALPPYGTIHSLTFP